MDSTGPELASIGEFARRSHLSPKALRLYDRLGLLPPARVDPESGYRWYATSQLERARLIAGLRELGLPLAEIGPLLDLGGPDAAGRLGRHWGAAEAGHSGRRQLALHLLDHLNGKEPAVYDVDVRDLPDRQILSLQRHLHASDVLTVGQAFMHRFWDHPVPALDGAAGASFIIFYGHVSEDSDGPLEFCRPVPAEHATELAARYPDLTLRADPAHQEAFVHLASAEEAGQVWLPVLESVETWGKEHHRQPGGPIRQLLIHPRTSPGYGPECDFAVPLVPGEFH